MIAVIALILIIRNLVENSKYYDILSIGVANSSNIGSMEPLEEELLEQFGDPEDKYQQVGVDTSYSFGSDMNNGDYNTMMKFAAVTAAQGMDILICNEDVYEHYDEQEYFMDLTNFSRKRNVRNITSQREIPSGYYEPGAVSGNEPYFL